MSLRSGRRPEIFYLDDDEEEDQDARGDPAEFSNDDDVRSKKHIAAWVELARLQTTFEVAFDAVSAFFLIDFSLLSLDLPFRWRFQSVWYAAQGVLKSGRDLRRVLDVIGEIDLTAPSRPSSTELCHDRIRNIVGSEMLEKLLEACTPEEDNEFTWSALAAQSMIEGIEKLMVCYTSLLNLIPCP